MKDSQTLLSPKHRYYLVVSLLQREKNELPILDIPMGGQQLPQNFDLRQQYPNCESIREIRDQSKCGSCWAIAAAEAMSDRICIHTRGKYQTRVSATNILACCPGCSQGCEGGYAAKAWQYWHQYGVPTGGLYGDRSTCQPYVFPPCSQYYAGKYAPCPQNGYQKPQCSQACVNGQRYQEQLTFGANVYQVPAYEMSIMQEIYTRGSVETFITITEDLLVYRTGIFRHVTGRELGGHFVKLIGWGVENGVKYWLASNSWNEGWGENGILRIIRGYNMNGIEGQVYAGMPRL